MKQVNPTFTFFLLLWLLICSTHQAHGSSSPLDASLITHDTLDLLRRQETTDSSRGDSDTAALTSPDGSTNISPDSTSNASSSPPPSPETTVSAETTSSGDPPASSTPPTLQTSSDPPAQSTSHQSIPGSATTTTTAAEVSTTTQQQLSEHSLSPTQSQAQKTIPSSNDAPSRTPPPTSVDPTSPISSSYAPVESAVTSINSTLVLGDMECASDPLAQQNGRCPANHYCNAALKQCTVQLDNGVTCAADFQCMSGYCIGTCTNRPTSNNNNTQALTGGQIAGITLGTIGGGLVALVGLLFCYRRRKRRLAAQQSRAMHFMLDGGDNGDGNGTEMADKRDKTATRLSKYNFLAQMLDGGHHQQRQSRLSGFESSQRDLAYHHTSPGSTTVNNDTHSILDYENEYYVSKSSLNHPPPLFDTRTGSSSTTALRPRPITDDFNNETFSYTSLSKTRPDSQALSMEQRYPVQQVDMSLATSKRMTNRDSLTDTALSTQQSPILSSSHRQFNEQQNQHFMDINTLWDDALHQSTNQQYSRHQPAPAVAPIPASQDAWSHEDQASLSSTAPATPRYDYRSGAAPPLPPGPVPSSSHPSFF